MVSRDRALSVREHLDARRDDMVDLLVELARMESPTDVPDAQRPVQDRLTSLLGESGFEVRHLSGRTTGGHLFAVPTDRNRQRPGQLIIGHSDTVWPIGTLERMPVVVENGRVRGPGTFDMKAGLVQALFAIRALRDLGCELPATPVWFINSDEETGSPESKRWVRLIARNVARAFVMEPAYGPRGAVKTARKGVARYTIDIRGRPAHAGLDPASGASAIEELAHVVRTLHALTDLDRGVSVNVGVVHGGTRPNVIAAHARAEIDVRMLTVEDGLEVARAIESLRPVTGGTSIEIGGGADAPPLERTERNRVLWHEARAAAERLGIELEEAVVGGGSDGNTTSQHTATLDGLGPIGDGAHAPHEEVVVDSMVERGALLAELLMAPVADRA